MDWERVKYFLASMLCFLGVVIIAFASLNNDKCNNATSFFAGIFVAVFATAGGIFLLESLKKGE